MYLTKLIQGIVAYCVHCVGSRALSVSGQDFPMAGGLLYTVCLEKRAHGVSDQDYPRAGSDYVQRVGGRALGVSDQ